MRTKGYLTASALRAANQVTAMGREGNVMVRGKKNVRKTSRKLGKAFHLPQGAPFRNKALFTLDELSLAFLLQRKQS